MSEIDDARRLLLLSAAGALTPLMLGVAGAESRAADAPNLAIAAQQLPAGVVPSVEVLQAAYIELKGLVKRANAWNPTFDQPYLAGSIPLLEQIASEEAKALTHNSRLVESLLGEISALVDRCIAYRREGADLELQGVSAGINKYLSYTLDEGDLAQSRIDPSYSMASVLADRYAQAASDLRDDPANKAVQLQLDALAKANERFADLQARRVSWQSGRLRHTQDIGRQLMGRYDTPGDAHNFAQRFDRIRRLFESDITSAYRRALAAREGLNRIFAFTDEKHFPTPDDLEFLDDLVQWTRNAMRAVARVGETEIEFTCPYVFERLGDGEPNVGAILAPPELKHLRLRAVGATFTYDGDPLKDSARTSAVFRLVLVKHAAHDAREPRVVIPLNTVRAEGPSVVPDYVTGAAVYNVNPRGAWEFRISTGWSNHNGYQKDTYPDWLKKIIIYMQMVEVPDQARDLDWWTSQDRV